MFKYPIQFITICNLTSPTIRFRWVACQLDYLCDCLNDADRRKALNELPPDLPETYRRLLERINKHPAKVKSLVRMCLQFIAFAEPPLTILQLQQAVSTPETIGVLLDASNLISEDEIGRRCSSLIRKSEGGKRFEFSHFSVQEFLTDVSLLNSWTLETYYITEFRTDKLLAMQCLRFLQLKNFGRHPESSENEADHILTRMHEYPFYGYAAMLWPNFARSHFEDPVLFNLANSLFQRPKTAQFLAWSIEVIRYFDDGEPSIFPIGVQRNRIKFIVDGVTDEFFSPLHLAAGFHIPHICQFLLDNKMDPNHQSAWGSPLEFATASVAAVSLFENDLESMLLFLELNTDIALKNKLTTLELLIGAGAALNTSFLNLGLNLLDLSFRLAEESLDLSASTKLMSLGVELGPNNPDSLGGCMSKWRKLNKHIDGVERSLHEFLSHLVSTSTHTTEIGCQIAALAYSYASEFWFPWASEFSLIGSNYACAEEFLRARAMTAVFHDDAETLQNYLINKRLDISRNFHPKLDDLDYGCCLLHAAAMKKRASVRQFLLVFGCDPSGSDSNGQPPIHLCVQHGNVRTLDVFLKKGASHLVTDSNGENIWHKSWGFMARDSVVKRLLELDQDQTTQALLGRSSSGETPLIRGLKNGGRDDTSKLLLIIDHCAGKPQFWKDHGPLFAAAAEFGSETVIEHLLQAGAEPDPIENDNLTPLHRLGSKATPECAQILKSLYPDAHQLRFEGRTPLEMYIETQLKHFGTVRPELVVVLATPEAISSQNTDGDMIWSVICKNFAAASLDDEQGSEDVILELLRLGALTSYEDKKRESGVLPLFSALKLYWEEAYEFFKGRTAPKLNWEERYEFFKGRTSWGTLSAIILESRYWDDVKRSSATVSFLKVAIEAGDLEAVKLLLEHGVSVHQRVDQESPMEFAVGCFSIAHKSMDEFKEIMLALFSHALAEEMKNYSPHGLGLGLLHMGAKAQHDEKSHAYWLLKDFSVGRRCQWRSKV